MSWYMYTVQAKIYEILWHKLRSALPCLSGKAVLSCTPVISDAMTMVNGLITHACNRPISNLYNYNFSQDQKRAHVGTFWEKIILKYSVF